MFRYLAFLYGFVSYVFFLLVFLYMIGFLGNFLVPKTIDSGVPGPVGMAIAINFGLIALFGLQHTAMARPEFKAWWTTLIPKAIERPTYVLLGSMLLAFLMWQWRPIPDEIWRLDGLVAMALWGLFAFGWVLILTSTFAINHFHLFGLQQVAEFFQNKPLTDPKYRENLMYKVIRHPLMMGWIIAFWATPVMTGGHFLFAVGTTAYILLALQYEEKDLLAEHGDSYVSYRKRVSMLIPGIRFKGK